MQHETKKGGTRAIVFIPGYKGSFLRESDTTLWLNFASLFKSDAFSLNYSEERTVQAYKILDRLPLPFGLYKDFYYDFLQNLADQLPNRRIDAFAYDWRLSLMDNIHSLSSFVTQLRREGVTEFDFIAHSLGGVLLSYYLKYGSQDPKYCEANMTHTEGFNNIFFAGVPFSGTIKGFRDINFGERVLFNRQLLQKEVVRTFPLAYQIFPQAQDFILDEKTKKKIDIFDLDNWKQYDFSGFNSYSLSEQNFIRNHIFNGHQIFKKILDLNPIQKSMKIHNFYGVGKKTLYGCHVHKNKIVLDRYADGDETIVAGSARLPKSLCSTTFNIEIPVASLHMAILHNSLVRNYILNELKDTN